MALETVIVEIIERGVQGPPGADGIGNVVGPASATDGHLAQFDGISGKLLKDGKAAPTGTIVGTSDTQTLSNKTFSTDTAVSYANSGGGVTHTVTNTATGALATARRELTTGTANSAVYDVLFDNSGGPYYQRIYGSAVTLALDDINTHQWRANNGTTKAQLNSSKEFTPGSASTGSLGTVALPWGNVRAAQANISANSGTPPAPSAGNLLHLAPADAAGARLTIDGYGAGPIINYRRYNNTAASPTAVASTNALGTFVWFAYDGTSANSVAQVGPVATENHSGTNRGTELRFATVLTGAATLANRWYVDGTGHWSPFADNTYQLGTSGLRVKEIFCANATINTSDATEKDWRGGLNDAEMRVAKRLVKLIGIYRWLASVAKKGDKARLHIGVTVQAVIAAFEAEGLDPWAYGVCCSDTFDVMAPTGELGEDGTPEMAPTGEKHTRLGLREGPLHSFMLAGIAARLDALEAH